MPSAVIPFRSSFVHAAVVFSISPPRGLYAARRGIARVPSVTEIESEMVKLRFISLSLVFGRWSGRKMLEHFVHAFVEVLRVLVGFVGERIARRTPPDQLLRLCVEEIDD